MNEKVLGLKESKIQELVNRHNCLLHRKDFVSVHLASESVSVEWLKKWCKKNKFETYDREFVGIEDLLSWAEKEAKGNELGK